MYTQTNIATYRLNRSRGWLRENHEPIRQKKGKILKMPNIYHLNYRKKKVLNRVSTINRKYRYVKYYQIKHGYFVMTGETSAQARVTYAHGAVHSICRSRMLQVLAELVEPQVKVRLAVSVEVPPNSTYTGQGIVIVATTSELIMQL